MQTKITSESHYLCLLPFKDAQEAFRETIAIGNTSVMEKQEVVGFELCHSTIEVEAFFVVLIGRLVLILLFGKIQYFIISAFNFFHSIRVNLSYF